MDVNSATLAAAIQTLAGEVNRKDLKGLKESSSRRMESVCPFEVVEVFVVE